MSPRYLLDTCVLVHLIRGDRSGDAIQKQFNLRAFYTECIISVVTWGEMEKLGLEFGWSAAKLKSMRYLLNQLIIVDINSPEIVQCYAEIDYFSDLSGQKMGKNDVWIAATAKATNYHLMTMDRDFDHLDPAHIQRIFIESE